MIFGWLFLVFGGSGNAMIHYGNVGMSVAVPRWLAYNDALQLPCCMEHRPMVSLSTL